MTLNSILLLFNLLLNLISTVPNRRYWGNKIINTFFNNSRKYEGTFLKKHLTREIQWIACDSTYRERSGAPRRAAGCPRDACDPRRANRDPGRRGFADHGPATV